MKEFLQISSNQITVFNPIEKGFILKSEIIISSIESSYDLRKTEKGETIIAKIPEAQTFRFFADAKDLRSIIDRINQELKIQLKIAKEHSLDPKY